jgi:cell wall-associated NlpC family hydrolase
MSTAMLALLGGCSASAAQAETVKAEETVSSIGSNTDPSIKELQDIMKQIVAEQYRVQQHADLAAAVAKLKKHVGKTWYVFSGSTPAGWDCSGLTLWVYEQMGITLPHRASQQEEFGTFTTDPKPGDIVVFYYKGRHSAYHVGIYIGDGKMIHAPAPGQLTAVEGVYHFGRSWSTIKYISIVK